MSKEIEYAIADLGEGPYRDNCYVSTTAYKENIAFSIYYPDSAVKGVDPHIMVYKHTYCGDNIRDFDKILGFCRLNVLSPSYMSGYNENLILSEEEIRFLMEDFKRERGDSGMSIWEYIDDCVHYNYNLDDIEDIHPSFIEMPNYLKLLE